MKLLLYSILARVQRDNKVVLHHFIFEGSHPHIICTANDAAQCRDFYGQLQKQITDSCKRLLGIAHLTLWEDRTSVIEIPTIEDAIDKIGYLYANPSNDDLESNIERYPGVSSWQEFKTLERLDDCSRSTHPWIRQPMIPKLPSASINAKQDRFFTNQMRSKAKLAHTLEIYPLRWIKNFIPTPSDNLVQRVRCEILENLNARESANSRRRLQDAKPILGANRFRTQALLKPHRPKKRGIKISVQSKAQQIRHTLINELQTISELCRQVYQQWKTGDFSLSWPPGTFPPPLPPLANYFGY